MRKKTLILINIVLLGIILTIAIYEGYPKRIYNRISPSAKYQYDDNRVYKRYMDLYNSYQKQGNIVMLGNSITFGVDWNELLNRTDVINRGISGDITLGMLNRLEHVFNAKPKICFIMGGINDVNLGISPEEIVQNLGEIAAKLKDKEVKPILLSILHVSENFPFNTSVNEKIKQTNTLISQLCQAKNIEFIDLNKTMSVNHILVDAYAYDGLHLNAEGYSKWRAVIKPVIEQHIPSN